MNALSVLKTWLSGLLRRGPRPYRLVFVEGDELPSRLPERALVVARDDGLDWVAGMSCPCGCGRRIELMLLPDVRPGWALEVGRGGLPSLHPSVWAQGGCRSHFWLRNGRIAWCRED